MANNHGDGSRVPQPGDWQAWQQWWPASTGRTGAAGCSAWPQQTGYQGPGPIFLGGSRRQPGRSASPCAHLTKTCLPTGSAST